MGVPEHTGTYGLSPPLSVLVPGRRAQAWGSRGRDVEWPGRLGAGRQQGHGVWMGVYLSVTERRRDVLEPWPSLCSHPGLVALRSSSLLVAIFLLVMIFTKYWAKEIRQFYPFLNRSSLESMCEGPTVKEKKS